MKKIIALAIVLIFVIGSCKKYPEGPAFTILTKRNRLENSWVIQQVIENGVDKTSDYKNVYKDYNLIIDKKGPYSASYTFLGFAVAESGSWAFNGDKTFVIFDPSSNNNGNTSWKIMKLKDKELWALDDDFNGTGNDVEFHMIPK